MEVESPFEKWRFRKMEERREKDREFDEEIKRDLEEYNKKKG